MTPLERAVTLSGRAARTVANYLGTVRAWQEFAGSDPQHWTGAKAAEWREVMLAQRLDPSTVNQRLAALRSASRLMGELGLGEHFARGVAPAREITEKKRHAFPLQTGMSILDTCFEGSADDIRDRALLTLGFRTGARRESLQRLDFADLKPPRITYWIKGGTKHTLVADPEVWNVLDDWIGWLFRHGVKGGRVFRSLRLSLDGPPVPAASLSLEGINYIVKRRGELAGVDNFTPHVMRHCCVSWLLLAGVPRERVKAITGHKTDAMIDLYFTDVEAEADPAGSHLPPLGGQKR